jgi:DNA mismatch endonuclease (patch repair protein)
VKTKYGFDTTVERSDLMKKIKGASTAPEILLRKKLWKVGLRYRLNVKNSPGKPDIVFRKYMLVVFIDGEFWHGFNWEEKKKRIKDNRAYWIPKIERNMQRDRENEEKLRILGFTIIRFWEAEIKKNIEGCVGKINAIIQSKS